MEVGLRMVIMGAVMVAAAGIALYLMTGEATGYQDFLGNQSSQSDCDVIVQQGKIEEAQNKGCSISGSDIPESLDCSTLESDTCGKASHCKESNRYSCSFTDRNKTGCSDSPVSGGGDYGTYTGEERCVNQDFSP